MKLLLVAVLISALFIPPAAAQSPVSGITPMNAAELRIALQKLRVTGTVLYVAAHPDDENAALLAYFSKGKKYRTVDLSLTRGEGGQNILGAEKGTDLGVIRTQELLDARRIDGAEQRFTRAIDFGFSKSPVESMLMWGRDSVVADLVWAIRSLRPDIIITCFSPTEGGHGNHTASAILAREAYKKSGDPSCYPDQLRYVAPWKAKKIFYNRLKDADGRVKGRQPDDTALDVGVYDPILGISYTEIEGISKSMHKTQAMGEEQRRGASPEYFSLTELDSSDNAVMRAMKTDSGHGDLFSGIDATWRRYKGGAEIDAVLRKAEQTFDPEHPDRIVPLLLEAEEKMEKLAHAYAHDPMLAQKRDELRTVITACLGLHMNAIASDKQVTPGSRFSVTLEATSASAMPVSVLSLRSRILSIDTTLTMRMQPNANQMVTLNASIPSSMPPTQPYWLRHPAEAIAAPNAYDTRVRLTPDVPYYPPVHLFLYYVSSQAEVGLPEDPDSLVVTCELGIGGRTLVLDVPVRHRTIDPVAGEVWRRVAVVPAVDVNFSETMIVWTQPGPETISVRTVSHDSTAGGSIRLLLPEGYDASPRSASFTGREGTAGESARFRVEADSSSASGIISASASTAQHEYGMYGMELSYPHIVPQHVMHKAQVKAVQADIRIVKRRIGYVMGSGDEVPAALRQCGYDVEPVTDDSLRNGALDRYETIVVGVRAYNVRAEVRRSNARLMDYIRNGGTLVVQYQTPEKNSEGIGPYPFRISQDRVTVEKATMFAAYPGGILPAAAHQKEPDASDTQAAKAAALLMSEPNSLTADDFSGWVQERGLYFADQWDGRYAAPFVCADPNETPKQGSLLAAPYGKGMYCYTGLSLFRQLPAGVPGAFRLLSNLVELRQR